MPILPNHRVFLSGDLLEDVAGAFGTGCRRTAVVAPVTGRWIPVAAERMLVENLRAIQRFVAREFL